MFTGLVEEIGTVLELDVARGRAVLRLAAPRMSSEIEDGESVAVNGCCLTATSHHGENLTFDLLGETLARTNLGALLPGSQVNLERALAAGTRLGGHFVQGHVDCTAAVLACTAAGADYRLEVELPGAFAQYVAPKGSVAVNGISLTVAEVLAESFVVWIIPHTKQHTNLDTIAPGDRLNLEFDLLAKYVERMVTRRDAPE